VGCRGQAKYATLESWTGRQLEAQPNIEEVVLRYLRAFGPASVMDVQNWSGLTRCKPVLERLRPQLETFRDELGKELFDLPDAPRPDPDLPAPVRLLGEFDNVLLGHADRRRIIPSGALPWMDILSQGRHVNNVLVDGMLRATWWIEREGKGRATLAIRPIDRLTGQERDEVEREARRMLDFAAADAPAHDIRFDAAPG
jgi:Winged helix DNA-binding domain